MSKTRVIASSADEWWEQEDGLDEHYVTPECCEEVKKQRTVRLYVEVYEDDSKKAKPIWVATGYRQETQQGVEVQFCPHCGKALPKIVKRKTTKKICVVSDGGYYCDTCKDRLRNCKCMPPEYAYVAEKVKGAL